MKEIKFRALVRPLPVSIPENLAKTHWEYYKTFDQPAWLDSCSIIVKDSQFTTIKDRNGKEVYGGDIVRCNPIGYTSTIVGEVIWLNDGWYVSDETERDLEKRLWSDMFGYIEVIGNKYENPELLK